MVALVRSPRRSLARSNAQRTMRSTPARVNTLTSTPTSWSWPWCARPPTPEYSPSEFSRTKSMSMSASARPASGVGTPGNRRTGRRLAQRSSRWRMGRIIVQSEMWSATLGCPQAPSMHASCARSVSSQSSDIIEPVACQRSAPQSSSVHSMPRLSASRTLRASAMTSVPTPSPGSSAIRKVTGRS